MRGSSPRMTETGNQASVRLILRLELPHEGGKARGDRSRERVVLDLKRLPERGEPSASIAGKHELARRLGARRGDGTVQRCARGSSSRRARLRLGRPRFILNTGGKPKRGFDHPATDPIIDPVGGTDRSAKVAFKSRA
jgi:hypothetical protein